MPVSRFTFRWLFGLCLALSLVAAAEVREHDCRNLVDAMVRADPMDAVELTLDADANYPLNRAAQAKPAWSMDGKVQRP